MKARILRKNRKQGQVPGTIESPKGALPTRIEIFAFDADKMEEKPGATVEDVIAMRKKWPMIWVNVSGLANADIISALGAQFNLHSLALEDVLHTPQRAKVDEYDDNIYVIVRMVEIDGSQPSLDQLSLFWGNGFVLSIQERPGDGFGPIRDRLRKGRRVKMAHSDYMAYALLDAVVDGYFPLLEQYSDNLDALEEKVLNEPSPAVMKDMHRIKKDLQILRLCMWPMRDAVSKLRGATDFVREETFLYLRDCQDHIIQVLDIIESYRERISAINDLYLSSVSNRLNEVMKVLTIIATIFIPLNLVASIYGMNFEDMPELHSPYGYPTIMTIMAALALGMLYGFRRAGWIGGVRKK